MFRLPRPAAYRMEHPPLAQAICQVQYPLISRVSTLDGISAFQDAVRGFLPYLEAVQQPQVALLFGPLGPAAPPGAMTTAAWKFTNDAGWLLSLEPGSATLAVGGGYISADDFGERLRLIARALADTLLIPRCDRLGVRYVDLVELNATGTDWAWTEWFRAELRGWLGETFLEDEARLVFHLTQSQLSGPPLDAPGSGPEPVQAIIRHGLVPIGTGVTLQPLAPLLQLTQPHFLLDQDFFVQGHQPFEPDNLVDQFRALQGQIDSFFRWALTPAGEQHFGVTEL